MKIHGIDDPSVVSTIGSDAAAGHVTLTFEFQDQRDRNLRAKVALAVAPEEAIEMVDQIIGELGRLGVKLNVRDEARHA